MLRPSHLLSVVALATATGLFAGDARACAVAGDVDQTIRACTDVITQRRTSRDLIIAAHLSRASALISRNDLRSAEADITSALQLDLRNASAYQARADLRLRQGNAQGARADYDEAVRFGAALLISTQANPFLLPRARFLRQQGDTARALADVVEVLRIEPQNPMALAERALLNRDANPQQALDDLNAVLAQTPNDVQALASRAILRRERGDQAGAGADLDRAVTLAPNDGFVRTLRAQYLIAIGRAPQALADLDAAIQAGVNTADVFRLRASVHASQNRRREALADYDQVLRLNPNDQQALQERTQLLSQPVNNATSPGPRGPSGGTSAGTPSALTPGPAAPAPPTAQDAARRIQELTEQIRTNQRSADLFRQRGEAYLVRNSRDLAIADFRRALQIDPNDQGSLDQLRRLGVTR